MSKNLSTKTTIDSTNIAHIMAEPLWLGDNEHKTIYVNPAFEKLSGYSLKEALGKPCAEFFDENSAKLMKIQHNLRKKHISSQYEAILVTKTQEKVPLLISGSPTTNGGSMGVFTNLTTVKKLIEQDSLAQQIVQHSTEAIVVLDTNRKIKLWNNGAVKMFGYKESDVLNESINFLIPKEESLENKKLICEVKKKNQIKNIETQRLNKNGKLIDVSLSVTMVMGEKKKFIGYLIIYRDISHEKQISNELQKRFEAIQDAYKELGLQKRYLDYMSEILEVATSNESSTKDLEKIIVSALSLLTKCDCATLRLCDKDQKSLKLKCSFGVDSNWSSKDKIDIKNSIAYDAYVKKRAIILEDVDNYRKHQGINLLKTHNIKVQILIPLFVRDHFLGSISLYATNAAKFRLIETSFLEKMGKQCSLALFTIQQD